MDTIYLDHNATSPIDPRVLDAMEPYWLSSGNTESRHHRGRSARQALTRARETIASILGAHEQEVIFTSGGTESNNLALFSLAYSSPNPGHIISTPLEHPAVAEPLLKLAESGYMVEHASVTADGFVEPEQFASLIRPHTKFATAILAHNETGAIQPIDQLIESTNQRAIPFHTDAVQAVGRIPVNFHDLRVATLAASVHKLHGPTGIGLLLVSRKVSCKPLLLGGHQQDGCRPGTLPLALAVGAATALKLWSDERAERILRWRELRQMLLARLRSALGPESVAVNGPIDPNQALPQTINLSFPNQDGPALLMQFDLLGLCVSQGAACASGSVHPSPSLLAMHIPTNRIHSSFRFSLGTQTSRREIDEAVARIIHAIQYTQSCATDPT